MITFAANTDLFRKRKRVHKACDGCKKRRKRCVHTFDGDGAPNLSSASNESPSHPTDTAAQVLHAQAADLDRAERVGSCIEPDAARLALDSRFVGYLSPEAVMRGNLDEQGNRCGGWVPATPDDDVLLAPSTRSHHNSGTDGGPALTAGGASPVENALKAYLDAMGVNTLPPERNVDMLLSIYFEYVQPLLPLIDQRHFYVRRAAGAQSTMLVQAMCLVACRHAATFSHLYLSSDPSLLLEPRVYAKTLYAALVAGVNADLEADRITLIQVLALMSLYSEGVNGADRASMHLAQAIHNAHTIGLQFGGRRSVAKGESADKIFWCLWSLDKLNASVNGRPQYMHERDNHLESWTARPEQRGTPFGIWLQLVGVLDRVIDLYRPGCDSRVTGLEADFPGFEEIIGDGGDKMREPIIATLELLYHSVAMLSFKLRSTTDPLQSTPSCVRQSLSAVRVISIFSHGSADHLPPLPLVPYALALAMSVAYTQYRQSRLQAHRNRAKDEIKACCKLLNNLRATWWCAGCMADLGAAALSKVEKAEPRGGGAGSAGTRTSHLFRGQLPSPASDLNLTTREQWSSPLATPTVRGLLDMAADPPVMVGVQQQHASSSERSAQMPLASANFGMESPEWFSLDNAFENIHTLLGSNGADSSSELLKGFDWDFGEFQA